MNRFKDKASFDARIESLSVEIKNQHMNVSDYTRDWSDARNAFGLFKMNPELWELVMKEFVPLIAGAIEFGRPGSFNQGRTLWNCVDPGKVTDKFDSRAMQDFVVRMQDLMNAEWRKGQENGAYGVSAMEGHVTAYRRYQDFSAALKKAGVAQFKLELTDHGMSAADVKQLEKAVAEIEAKIGKSKEPPAPKEPLFEAPKKGKHAVFDNAEYVEYLRRLREQYVSTFEGMTGFSGMSLQSDHIEQMMTRLADFDYAQICTTLGAQKRWPPEDDYGSNGKAYEYIATLPQSIGRIFDEKTAAEIEKVVDQYVSNMKSDVSAAHSFQSLRSLKGLLTWLGKTFPAMESEGFSRAKARVAKEYDPRWATMSAGAVHEKHMGEIRFSNSATLPPGDFDWPETLNPAKDAVYGHIFLDQALENLGDMYFVEMGGQWLQASKKVMSNSGSAYQVLQLFPDPAVGCDPQLVQAFGKALDATAADGELVVKFSPNTREAASGTLKLKLTKADIGKLAKRAEELAAAAEANVTKGAVLPEVFAKAQKWPYKDKVLAPEKLMAAIEEAWEYNSKERIKVKHLRVNHYRPGYEWDQEVDPLNRPTQRLTFSYVGMIFEKDGKTYCVDDGVQFRQFYMMGKGYGDDLNVLFWGAKPFALPPEQVKRVAA